MSIAVQADGKILAGGDFIGANSIGGQTRNCIARLDATTGLADSFDPNANNDCLFNRGAGGRQDFSGRRFFGRTASADRRAITSPGSMPPPAWLIRSTRTRTIIVHSIAVQADGKILAGGNFNGAIASADRRATTSPGSMPRPAWRIRSIRTRTMLSIQSRCRRTARFWRAALSWTTASADRRATTSPGSMPHRLGRFVQPEREQCCPFNRGAGGRQDFGGRRFHGRTASADRRAITSPGSMPRPAWLIRSTRTRTVTVFQSRCRRTARFWRAALSPASADRRAAFSLV